MKSEVKKKMMLDEHATPTPKSLKRAQVENFDIGNWFDRVLQREFRVVSTELCSTFVSVDGCFKQIA